jgi:signal transduction histidine kinase
MKASITSGSMDTPMLDLLKTAERQHTELVDKINTFEADLRYPHDPETLLTTRHLATALSEMFAKAGYKDIAIVGKACDTIFWLKGSVADLFQMIEPIVRNGVAAAQAQEPTQNGSDLSELFFSDLEAHDYDFWIDPHELNQSTKVLLGFAILFSLKATARLELRIRDAGIGIPTELVEAIRDTSAFSRLPSDRLDGGRGMLSVISAIKALYHSDCIYAANETAWKIAFRVRLGVAPEVTESEKGSK